MQPVSSWLPSCQLRDFNHFGWIEVFHEVSIYVKINSRQSLHLTQLELELHLQPDRRHLYGNVETRDPVDLRELLRVPGLHQRADWTNETDLPWWDGWEGTPNLNCSGFDQANWISSEISFVWYSIQGGYYNAYEKDIAVVNIFFGKSTVFGKFLFYLWHVCFAKLTLRCFT